MGPVLIHGMVVRAPVPLPAGPAPGIDGPADVVFDVRRETETETETSGTAALVDIDDIDRGQRYRLTRTVSGWHLSFPGAMDVVIPEHGPHVEVRARPDLPDGLLSVLLGGPTLSLLAMVRGATLLHGSAVTWPDLGQRSESVSADPSPGLFPVVAFVGPPGAGKSTLAQLVGRGPRQVFSDDALAVQPGPAGPPEVHRGSVESRIRASPHVRLVDDSAAARRSADGRVLVRAETAPPARGRLAAVVLPRLAGDVGAPRLREVATLEAMMLLATSWPVAGVVDPGLAQRQLELAGRLVSSVPVRALDVPWPPPASVDELAAAVTATLQAGLAPVVRARPETRVLR